jgi:hypothetical protein
VHAQRDGRRRLTATLAAERLRIGRDALSLSVTPDRDGHLYVALAGSDGRSLYLLYPNALAEDNVVKAGQPITLPGARWQITADGPQGRNRLLVMLADSPRDWRALRGEPAGPFLKTLLDTDGRARLQGLLANRRDGCAPGCTDAFASVLLSVDEVP